jgi:hypothetical protein
VPVSLRRCTKCGYPNPALRTTCFSCGQPLGPVTSARPDAPVKVGGGMCLGLVVLLALVVWISCGMPTGPSRTPGSQPPPSESAPGPPPTQPTPPAEPDVPGKSMIRTMSKEFVKANLKAPSSARFPFYPSEYVIEDLGSGRYRVASWVESENSFGAMLRSPYAVEMRYLGAGQWQLDAIVIQSP